MNDPKDYERINQVTLFGKSYWWGRPRGKNGPVALFRIKPKIKMQDVFSTLLN